jgi:thioredoxin-like negative regulator of GroEL
MFDIKLTIKRDDGMKVEKKVKDIDEENLDSEVSQTAKDVLNTVYNSWDE